VEWPGAIGGPPPPADRTDSAPLIFVVPGALATAQHHHHYLFALALVHTRTLQGQSSWYSGVHAPRGAMASAARESLESSAVAVCTWRRERFEACPMPHVSCILQADTSHAADAEAVAQHEPLKMDGWVAHESLVVRHGVRELSLALPNQDH